MSQSDAARYRRAHSVRCGNDRGKRSKGASAGNVGNSRRAAATTSITQPFFLLSDLVSIGLAVRWHLSPRARAYAVFLHPHAPYRHRRTRLSLSTGKSTEPDTHGREVATPSYTDLDGPNARTRAAGFLASAFAPANAKLDRMFASLIDRSRLKPILNHGEKLEGTMQFESHCPRSNRTWSFKC